jgi:capsular exopolysaccharide synthesis family protein
MQKLDPNLAFNHPDEEEGDAIDIKSWILRILRLWPWFMVIGLIAISAGMAYLHYAEPVYQSVAAILVKDDSKGGGSVLDNPLLEELNIGGKGKLVENEIEVINSFNLLREVVRKEHLYLTIKNRGQIASWTAYGDGIPFILEIENPEAVQNGYTWVFNFKHDPWMLQTAENGNAIEVRKGKWYLYKQFRFRFWPNPDYVKTENPDVSEQGSEYEITISPIQSAAQNLKGQLSVAPVGKVGSVIGLTLTDLNSTRATDVLNSIIEIYNRQGLDDKKEVNTNTIDFLNVRLKVVERELKAVEGQVENYKRANRITNVSSEADVYLDMAKEIDRLNSDQQTRVNIINELERDLLLNQNNSKVVPGALGLADPTVSALINRHNELVLQRDRLEEKAGYKNPALIAIDNQVRDLRSSLLENVKNLKAGSEIALRDISQENRKLSAKLMNIPAIEKNLIQISRDRNVQEELYIFLLQKREEIALALASTVKDNRIIEDPRSAGQIRPDKTKVLSLAAGIGLFLPILFLFIRDFFDNKIGSRFEIEKSSKAPLLGEIGYIVNMKDAIEISPKSRSAVSEQLRGIRTAISFTVKGDKAKTIMITSHQPGEGKSFTCLNLGASYALLDKKVVILEFDLRKPRLMRNLGFTAVEGISNYLAGKGDLDTLLVDIPGYNGNFSVLPTGTIPPNPAELILGPYMEKLMDALKERFDFIIIDSPPFALVTDATLLQHYADMGIIILRQGYSIKESISDINNRTVQFPDFPYYIILNGVGRSSKYSYYGSKYADKNGYGYYGDQPKHWFKRLLDIK